VRAADVELLAHAWEVVRRNDAADGVRSSGVEHFGDELTANLERIAAALRAGTYLPGPLVGVSIPKSRGGTRKLKIPGVSDRVVERALVDVLADVADPWFTPWSFVYRPGLSVADAHRMLAAHRDDGATHVVRADLKDCFDRLDRTRVRFADDLAVPVADAEDAARALRHLTQEVARVGLELNTYKTGVMSFAEGFAFLGEEFAGAYPQYVARRQQPDQRSLYVGRQGAVVHVAKGKMLVGKDGQELLQVPLTQVGRVVLFGAVGLSAGARAHALYHHMPVVLLSRRGNYLGRIDSSDPGTTAARRKQYATSSDPVARQAIVTPIVTGKIANQRALLLRYAPKAPDPQRVVARPRSSTGWQGLRPRRRTSATRA
jgi:hypothetical protein